MSKTVIGPRPMVYPLPISLVGANVNGKPNFTTIAYCCPSSSDPPIVSVGLRHVRYTLKGIRENMTFSINIASKDMVKEVDYCGLATGHKYDKVEACKFKVFYGKLGNAPLIEQFPLNMECKVVHILDIGNNSLVIGRIEETYVSEQCLTNGKPDIDKIQPLAYVSTPETRYYALGEFVAKAFSVGQELKKEKTA
ncbi:MAG: flavin reductase family protein [Chloroflexota bacterium]